MNYKVVVADVSSDLSDFMLGVDTQIREGWIPQGGIFILEDRNDNTYAYQAMIRPFKKAKGGE